MKVFVLEKKHSKVGQLMKTNFEEDFPVSSSTMSLIGGRWNSMLEGIAFEFTLVF
jgi:hypothetical protein